MWVYLGSSEDTLAEIDSHVHYTGLVHFFSSWPSCSLSAPEHLIQNVIKPKSSLATCSSLESFELVEDVLLTISTCPAKM